MAGGRGRGARGERGAALAGRPRRAARRRRRLLRPGRYERQPLRPARRARARAARRGGPRPRLAGRVQRGGPLLRALVGAGHGRRRARRPGRRRRAPERRGAARGAGRRPDGVFAVVATAGTTNLGLVDDLAGVAAACRERGLWLHVDGAYGAAALCAPSVRERFAGIERADSLIVDPHKWLFAPFDSCALLYREPGRRAARRTARAPPTSTRCTATRRWNPSDYGLHLTRRARGLPFWFSLAAHGTARVRAAVERTLEVTRAGAAEIRRREQLELLAEPELSVLVFRRRGWAEEDYHRWAAEPAARRGRRSCSPRPCAGETVARLALVNPRTTRGRPADRARHDRRVRRVLDELAPGPAPLDRAAPRVDRRPEAESPADWPPEVGSVAYAAPEAFVIVDPLVADGAVGAARRAGRAPRQAGRRADHDALPLAQPRRGRRALRRRAGVRATTSRRQGVGRIPIEGGRREDGVARGAGRARRRRPPDRRRPRRPADVPGVRGCATLPPTGLDEPAARAARRCSTSPWSWCSSRTAIRCCAAAATRSARRSSASPR